MGGRRGRSGKTGKVFASRAFGFYSAETGGHTEGLMEKEVLCPISIELISHPLCLHFTCQNVQTGSGFWWVFFMLLGCFFLLSKLSWFPFLTDLTLKCSCFPERQGECYFWSELPTSLFLPQLPV